MGQGAAIQLDFPWLVSEAGYEWRLGKGSKALLCEKNVPGARRWVYQPLLEYPALFRDFAKLVGRDDIRRFADQYGVIFNQYGPSDVIREPGEYHSVGAANGTSLNVWAQEIADLSFLIDMWDSINAGRVSSLRHLISWKMGGAIEYQFVTPRRKSWKLLAPAGAVHPFKEGEVLNPARHALQGEINNRLSDGDSDRISYPPRLVRNAAGRLQIVLRPRNLLSAIWLQFAQVVGGSYELRNCAMCSRHFLPSRSDAITCSDVCRQKKSRKNRGATK